MHKVMYGVQTITALLKVPLPFFAEHMQLNLPT